MSSSVMRGGTSVARNRFHGLHVLQATALVYSKRFVFCVMDVRMSLADDAECVGEKRVYVGDDSSSLAFDEICVVKAISLK